MDSAIPRASYEYADERLGSMFRSSTASLLSTSTLPRFSSVFSSSFSSCSFLFKRGSLFLGSFCSQSLQVTLNEFFAGQQGTLNAPCIIDARQDILVLFPDQPFGLFHSSDIRIDDDHLSEFSFSIKYRRKC